MSIKYFIIAKKLNYITRQQAVLAHIWPAWILHGPDVGRIWANTMLLSNTRRSMIPGESYPPEFPIIPMTVWIPASEIPSFQPSITYFLIWNPYILDENMENTISDMMKLDSYSSKLQNGHKQPYKCSIWLICYTLSEVVAFKSYVIWLVLQHRYHLLKLTSSQKSS